MKKPAVSLLAQALGELIKVSGTNQSGWAFILGVTPAAISQWLSDAALPKARHIRGILSVVRPTPDTEVVLENFYRMAELPAEQVTPHHEKVRGSIGYYLSKDLYEGLHGRIRAIVFMKSLKENENNFQKIADFLSTI